MSSSVVDGLPFSEEKKKYILETLDPILEELVTDVLTEMPKQPVDFMAQWLRKRSGTTHLQRTAVKTKNAKLKEELRQLTGSLQEAGTVIDQHVEEEEEEESEEEDDDCDEIPESMRKPTDQLGRARQSVSAEAYGAWNQKKAFTPPKISKTDEQKDRLTKTLNKSFMFNELEPNDMETILLAMKEVKFTADQKVITEGEDGDYLFVVEEGSLDCIKLINDAEKVVKTCGVGDVFGELALLYNCPRAASVESQGDSVCWQLDRDTFNYIVKEAAQKKRNRYDAFLAKVPLLASMDAYERSQLADALRIENFDDSKTVCAQGEVGKKFYIVEEGSLVATKNGQEVMQYGVGDYFGELALLTNQPRQATISTKGAAKLLSIDAGSFKRLLNVNDLLERSNAMYGR